MTQRLFMHPRKPSPCKIAEVADSSDDDTVAGRFAKRQACRLQAAVRASSSAGDSPRKSSSTTHFSGAVYRRATKHPRHNAELSPALPSSPRCASSVASDFQNAGAPFGDGSILNGTSTTTPSWDASSQPATCSPTSIREMSLADSATPAYRHRVASRPDGLPSSTTDFSQMRLLLPATARRPRPA